MTDLFPPQELVARCNELVRITHETVGYGNLAARIATKSAMGALAVIPQMIHVVMEPVHLGRFRVFLWAVAAASVVLAAVLSPFWVVGLVVAIICDRLLASAQRKQYVFLMAVLLSLEVLAVDFAGWGASQPAARDKARAILGADADYAPLWIDFYLPNRASLDPAIVMAFGPHAA